MKKRGRPRQFNEEAVVAAMEVVFWRQGLTATTLDDIAGATGLNRPSLYSAFGSKIDMYLLCLEAFGDRMTGLFQSAFEQSEKLEDTLADLFSGLIATYFLEDDTKVGLGCLVFSNAVAEAPTHEGVKTMITSTLDRIRTSVAEGIAAQYPSIDKCTAAMVTELSLSTILGLGIQIRSGVRREDVQISASCSARAIGRLQAC